MTATGVTFKLVNITWGSRGPPVVAYSESIGTARSAIIAKDISKASRGTKIEQPVPPAASGLQSDKPIFFPMGQQGVSVKLTSYIKSAVNFALWDPIVQGNLLYIDTAGSEYAELPPLSYWWVDQNTISRKGGMTAYDPVAVSTGLWNHELVVIRSWRKGDQTLR